MKILDDNLLKIISGNREQVQLKGEKMQEIKGEYTVRDYLIANRLHMARSPYFRLSRIICYVMVFLLLLAALTGPSDFILWVFLTLFSFIITYPYLILPHRVKRYFKIQKQMHGEITISFDSDEGTISSKSETGEGKTRWIFKYLSNAEILLLFNTPLTFMMVPRRFCRDEEQFNRFIELAKKMSGKS